MAFKARPHHPQRSRRNNQARHVSRRRIMDLDIYESFVLGNSHKVKFSKGRQNYKGILYHIHSDL